MLDLKPLAFALVPLALAICRAHAADEPGKLVPFAEDEARPKASQPPPSQPKPSQPALQPAKSNFQPKFRSPAIRQAQHTEPVKKDGAAPKEAVAPADDNAKSKAAAEPKAAATKPAEPTPAQAKPEPKPEAKAEAKLEPTPAPENRAKPEPAASPEATKKAAAPAKSELDGKMCLDEAFKKSKVAASEAEYTEIINLCRQGLKANMSQAYHEYGRRLMGWAYNRRGEAKAQGGNDVDALADFEAAVEAGGGWRAIHNRGVSYAAVGKLKEASADFDRAIELKQDYPNAYFNRGELRYKQEDFQGAVDDYTMALRLGPPDAAVSNSRGHAFYRLERFGDALRDYGESIRLDPENAAALINRGDVYSDLGQYGEAAEDYRTAVKVSPKLGRAYQAAAWLMATCPDQHYRDEKLAVDAARRAVELDGATYRTLSTLAAAQASANLYDEAKESQEKAIAAGSEEEKATGQKLMSLYERKIAFRDQPVTSFKTPEEMDDKVQQASANEPIDPKSRPNTRRPAFQGQSNNTAARPQRLPLPPQAQQMRARPQPQPQQYQPPQKARLFGPRGNI